MKRFRAILPLILFILLHPPEAIAEDIRHTFAGNDLNSFYIDDRGGSVNNGGSDNSYYLNLLDIDQSAFGTLFLYADDGNQITVDDGLVDEDFVNPSGISLFDLSVLPGTVSPGEIGLALATPLTPVSFSGSQSGLIVEQVSYTSDDPGARFILVEYRVVNPSSGNVQARIALSNDLDVDLKSDDAAVGYDDSNVPTVYQQEAAPLDPNHTTVGVSLLHGTLIQYRLEVCSGAFGPCEIFADDNDVIRKAFFQGANGQVGDLTGGVPNQDFAVTIAADLGSIPPGAGVSVVFCYNIGQGPNPSEALNDCLNEATHCETFYQNEIQHCGNGLVNFGEGCDDGDNNQSDSCPDGDNGSCQAASCGDGFLWTTDGGSEECDNGNSNSDTAPDACRTNCKNPSCGDSVADTGEQCDDGDLDNKDACLTTCLDAKCGDGFVRTLVEVCDDGNNVNGDGCSADCQSFESCGNGNLDPGEACDDGNSNTTDSCPDGTQGICQPASCGDGYLWNKSGGTEQCDDGNKISGDGCSAGCVDEDGGFIDPSGNPSPPVCGNGFVEVDEDCDDGNNVDQDGCASNCQFELVLQGSGNTTTPVPPPTGGCSFHRPDPATRDLGLLALLAWLGVYVVFLKRRPKF